MALRPAKVYAIRYATHDRQAEDNFLQCPPGMEPHAAMPMDYFVWLICSMDGRHVLADTGFSKEQARRRHREYLRCPTKGLARLGVDPASIDDVILTHLHYDHAGNTDLFPNARFWLQERELSFSTGRYMCWKTFSLAYEPSDVSRTVEHLFGHRVELVNGDRDFSTGVALHHVGGHTGGMQVVRVWTEVGWIVLASDLFHYYANIERSSPFPIVYRVDEMLEAFSRVTRMVDDPARHLVPGHDLNRPGFRGGSTL